MYSSAAPSEGVEWLGRLCVHGVISFVVSSLGQCITVTHCHCVTVTHCHCHCYCYCVGGSHASPMPQRMVAGKVRGFCLFTFVLFLGGGMVLLCVMCFVLDVMAQNPFHPPQWEKSGNWAVPWPEALYLLRQPAFLGPPTHDPA